MCAQKIKYASTSIPTEPNESSYAKKIRKYLIRSAVTILALLLLWAASSLTWNFFNNSSFDVYRYLTLNPTEDLRIGENIHGRFELILPWNIGIRKIEMQLPDGLIEVNKTTDSFAALLWNGTIRNIDFTLRAVDKGQTTAGSVKIYFNDYFSPDMQEDNLELEIPPLEIGLRDQKPLEELPLADSLTVLPGDEGYRVLMVIVGVLAVLFIFGYWLWKKYSTPQKLILLPWQQANLALAELKKQFSDGQVNVPDALGLLTDILRHYLETRFALPATRQTTEEFLTYLRSHRNILAANDQNSLIRFLDTADLVKFAGQSIQDEVLLQAIDMGMMLVDNTAEKDESSDSAATNTEL